MFRIKHCREVIFKLLYQMDVLDLSEESASELLKKNHGFFNTLTQEENEFVVKIIEKSVKEKEMIDHLISINLIGWTLNRLMAVDRCLLRLGIAESFFNKRKPVIIDDIIRIAKKYGGNDTFKIVNAILDKALE